ncbi:MAG: hypothetical protein WCK07_05685 [Betaproteobacteria bacterium]
MAFIIVGGLFNSPTGGYCGVPQGGITRQTSDAAKFASLQFFVSQLNLLPSLKKAESMSQKTAAIEVAAC